MTKVVLGEEGSKRRWRFRFVFLPLLLCATVALLLASSAQAVHDLKFQLDGDVSLTCYPAGAPGSGGNAPCQSQTVDWGGNVDNSTSADTGNGLFVVSHPTASTESVTANSALVPSVFAAASFTRDFESGANCTLNSTSTTFCTGDDTTYATGSKDTLGIGNGGWQCNHDANVNSKIDIMNSYIASYHNSAGDLILYFGLEKNKNNGTNDVGVWFLRGDASCTAPSGHHNFTGQHQDGDVLVVSEFTAGGGVSTIKAFRWAAAATGPLSGDGGCIDSHDNPDPSAFSPGVTPAEKGCNGKAFGTGQDCKGSPTGAADIICATTNATGSAPWNQNVTTPWLTADATLGVGHTAVPPDFFEGGINITQAFSQAGGGTAPSCFSVGIPDTRSSASLTATLFDFVINKLGSCASSLSTQQNFDSTTNPIGTNGTISSGTDTTTLNITGTAVWGGTLTWYLCGPTTVSAGNPCTVGTRTNGTSGGVLITSRTVSNSSPATDFVSGAATLTSAGTYCWHSHFDPDAATAAAGVLPADDDGTNECFTVTPRTPTLATSASCTPPTGQTGCVPGSTLSDSATLTGTAKRPGSDGGKGVDLIQTTWTSINATNGAAADGSVTFTLYGPESGGCTSTRTLTGTNPAPVSNNSAGPVSYTTIPGTDPPGTYTFVAQYSGDSPNTLGAGPSACPDTTGTETETLIDTTSVTSAQNWLPNDSGTVSSANGSTLNGTLSIQLFDGSGDCTTGAVSTQIYTRTLTNATSPQTVTSNNTTYTVTATDTVSWLVTFVPTAGSGVTGSSHCESTSLTITN